MCSGYCCGVARRAPHAAWRRPQITAKGLLPQAMPAAANAAAALHARLDAAKRRVQSDLASGSRRPPRLSRQPRTRGRRAESSATTRVVPDRLSPPRRAPAAAPRTPGPPPSPGNESFAATWHGLDLDLAALEHECTTK